MSRKYVNDRWCVRCSKMEPTPFLKEMVTKHSYLFQNKCNLIDIGCGNCRNSNYFRDKFSINTIESIDMAGDYGTQIVLGKDPFPANKYGIVLANYIFMFLNAKERKQVFNQIQKNTESGSSLVLELYKAKDSEKYTNEEITGWFVKHGWKFVVNRKDHYLMERMK